MAERASLVLRLVASSVVAANRAGKIIRDIMSRGDLGIVDKGKNDLQTEADRSAQRCIIASLSLQYPSITIIGEEGASNTEVPSDWIVTDGDQSVLSSVEAQPLLYGDVQEKDICVWVDPLDGTSEYTQGLLDHVTVLVGVAVRGRAVGGVIHQPYHGYAAGGGMGTGTGVLGRTLWGVEGVGCGGWEPRAAPPGRLVVATTRSHGDALVQAALDALRPDEVVRAGGAGHKVIMLLEGAAHAYVFASGGTKKWDTCGPQAVLAAAGGRLTDMLGRDYCYSPDVVHANRQGIFATGPGVSHADYLERIPQELLQKLT